MTPLDFLVIVLSALTLHRIWNYEALTASLRGWIDKWGSIKKPLLCPACNAFWWGLASVAIWYYAPFIVCAILAAFMPMRVAVWCYAKLTPPAAQAKPAPVKPQAKPPVNQAKPPAQPAKIQEGKYEKTVIILTALNDFRASYSVAIDVLHQARALAMTHPTWEIQVWMSQGAQQNGWEDMPSNAVVKAIVPRLAWAKDKVSPEDAQALTNFLLAALPAGATVIEHDLLFVSWYIPFATAMHNVGAQRDCLWFHVSHSMPGPRAGKDPSLVTLPQGRHFLAPVARGAEQKFADYYATTVDKVVHVPNVFDPRVWGDVTPRVRKIVTTAGLMNYDFVQVLPACTTRLDAKGLANLGRTFALLNQESSAFLLFCNPNASDKLVTYAREKLLTLGLAKDRFAFVSEIAPDAATYGLSGGEVKTLMQDYGNLFVFPSISESDSRVCMEAKACRQFVVGNKDVPALQEHANHLVSFGTTAAMVEKACADATELILNQPNLKITRHSKRNLEGIGNQWGSLITTAGPSATP